MFYTALGENIFGAISVLWCGFYFNRMALCKDTAEEWFCELSHFRLDTLQTANATSRTFFFFLEGGEMLLLVSCIVIDLPRAGEPSMIEVGSSCEVSGPSLLIEYHFYNVNVLKPHKPNSFHHTLHTHTHTHTHTCHLRCYVWHTGLRGSTLCSPVKCGMAKYLQHCH